MQYHDPCTIRDAAVSLHVKAADLEISAASCCVAATSCSGLLPVSAKKGVRVNHSTLICQSEIKAWQAAAPSAPHPRAINHKKTQINRRRFYVCFYGIIVTLHVLL